jgi:hypothetical protein
VIGVSEDIGDAGDLLQSLASIDIVVIERLSRLGKVRPPISKAMEKAGNAEGQLPPLRCIARREVVLYSHIFPREGT